MSNIISQQQSSINQVSIGYRWCDEIVSLELIQVIITRLRQRVIIFVDLCSVLHDVHYFRVDVDFHEYKLQQKASTFWLPFQNEDRRARLNVGVKREGGEEGAEERAREDGKKGVKLRQKR